MALQLQIASPCSESWASMRGDERRRFCQQCKLNVFNVSELTEPEVRALFLKSEGRVCGRIYRRRDGTVLTRDCPTGLRAVRLRLLRGVAAAITLIAGLVGYRAFTFEPSCPADGVPRGASALRIFENRLHARYYDAVEALRETETFGWLIDRISPPPRTGRLMMIPVIRSSGGAQPPVE
ncbi:MAG: hypothetical protein QM817_16820 [Archangium sp.]